MSGRWVIHDPFVCSPITVVSAHASEAEALAELARLVEEDPDGYSGCLVEPESLHPDLDAQLAAGA